MSFESVLARATNHFKMASSPGNRAVEITERDRAGIIQRRWIHHPGQAPIETTATNKTLLSQILAYPSTLTTAFLPVGFPHSVSADYLAYQTYDSLQAFFSTITSLLASRALLQGLGVGDAESSATFALLLTILNDATSRVATILFAQRFGLRIEPDAKRYRFLADVFNDTAFFLDLASPFLGTWGKILALSTARALVALCGVAAGASKAALSVHFAKQGNMAELNAKEASQETAVGLVGLLVGSVVVRFVEEPRTVVALMVILVLLHLWVNYLGVRSVNMTSLNRQRTTILVEEYIASGTLLTPEEVAERESIVFWSPHIAHWQSKHIWHIEVARDYGHATAGLDDMETIGGLGFTLYCSKRRGIIRILLKAEVDAEPTCAINAWAAAVCFVRVPTVGSRFAGGRGDSCYGRPSAFGIKVWYGDASTWRELAQKGWDIKTQGIETGAPVRFEMLPAEKKGQ